MHAVSCAADLDEALHIIVERVRETMGVDVCTVYLTDQATRTHVLMATEGLNPNAVGRVRLGFDEGLVGLVAQRSEPINVQDAPHHPRYKFVPQCDEQSCNAFLGVPIIHQGEPLGVLVVQQNAARRFKERDVAFLVTLAAQLAGLIALAKASGAISSFASSNTTQLEYLDAVAGAPGIALGIGVVAFSPAQLDTVPDRVAEDPQAEETVFRTAVADVIEQLQRLSGNLESIMPAEDRALFEAYAMIAGSDSLIEATVDRIRAGRWAPGALRDTIQEHVKQFEAMEDPYLRERANDIRDLGQRILARVQQQEDMSLEYPQNTILVGDNLSPIELAKVPTHRLAGVVSGHGSSLSHLSILAHALGIPAVVGVASRAPISQLDGRVLVADGYRGRLYVDPSEPVRHEFARLIREERALTEQLRLLRDQPAVTPDGIHIPLYTNAGILADLSPSLEVGAQGIGLYRTELPFMLREQFPTEEEQRVLYRQVLKAFAPRPVTLRTLDVGGDKPLPYFSVKEPNPALGWRGIRLALDNPTIFLTQLRAMLRAAVGLDNLGVLIPMISGVEEVEETIRLLQRSCQDLRDEGENVKMPRCGVMIEVPSAVFQADALARRVDFLSIGTNDLTQYLLAVDRSNERVAKLFEALHPSVLLAVRHVSEAGHRHNKPVGVCGEAAGDPAMAILLLGMGVDSLSMSASDLPRIKSVIRTFSRQQARDLLERALHHEKPAPIRQMLTKALVDAGLGGLVRPGKS